MQERIWKLERGTEPLIATAIHNGHFIRQELLEKMYISEADRLQEEDPFTEIWTEVAKTRVVGLRSRFEVDLNRPREKAIYIKPEDAWNLKIWKSNPTENDIIHSLSEYDTFYTKMHRLLTDFKNRYGHFVLFDFHSYNHMRNGEDGPAADPDANPEVNVGTGTMDRIYWTPVVDSFITSLSSFNFFGRKLDVRENVRFRGGNFPYWVHQNFPKTGCAIAIEIKKFFMNEWTGEPDHQKIDMIAQALNSVVPEVLDALKSY
jgi:N-formylglutamate amidohydrolase